MLVVVAFLVAGYLCGSFPTAYIVARLVRGIDIREYGSGNPGGSNVMRHVSPVAGVAVGVVDAAKALLPMLLGLHVGGAWVGIAAAAGATAGHCWSPWLGFTGGRGMACIAASLLPINLPGDAFLVLTHIAGGLLFKRAALADWLALVALPLVALLVPGDWLASTQVLPLQDRWPIVAHAVMVLAIVTAKRLEANGAALPADPARRRAVLRYRVLYDRDVAPSEDWMGRTPQSAP